MLLLLSSKKEIFGFSFGASSLLWWWGCEKEKSHDMTFCEIMRERGAKKLNCMMMKNKYTVAQAIKEMLNFISSGRAFNKS